MARRLTGEQLRDRLVARGLHWQYAKAVEQTARDLGAYKTDDEMMKVAGQAGFTVRHFRRSGRFVLKFKEAR